MRRRERGEARGAHRRRGEGLLPVLFAPGLFDSRHLPPPPTPHAGPVSASSSSSSSSPARSGKSAVTHELARQWFGDLHGTSGGAGTGGGSPGGGAGGLVTVPLFRDMSARDLLQRRATSPLDGSTVWMDSPLVAAARRPRCPRRRPPPPVRRAQHPGRERERQEGGFG